MSACSHGLEAAWCYLCRIDQFGVDPQILWGIALDDDLAALAGADGPMTPDVAGYFRFLCDEFEFGYDSTFTQHEAAVVIESFLGDGATTSQLRTIGALSGEAAATPSLTYGEARTRVRRAIALRGLRSA